MNRYAFILILSMLLVGSNVGIGKTIVVVVPVAILATLRFVIANAVLWPLWRPSKMRTVKRDEWLNLFLQALFGTFLFTLLMLTGVQRTSAVAAGVITSTIPAVVALFAWIFLRERPDGRALLSIALAIVGVVAINLANGHAPGAASAVGSSLAGNLLILGAVCCESFYVILSRRLTETLRPLDICAYTHLFGMLLMLPLGLLALPHFDYAAVPTGTWALVVWYALSASIFSFCLWMIGIRHVPGSLAGVFSAVLPIAAAVYGIAFLGERPTLAHGFALACVVTGILLASLKPRGTPTAAS
ncbi:DMT family transporter [Burkholderia gladioli]|uniref:EamA/RhaT family transporter n=2 Tax=Burkholderia gladioli TaxID=28095 RepID=A0A2A7S1J2_BURGA|nr:DMT family transporter [Burkholderia gladioli]ATF86861.1 EamA family transporter [Burkholderia gladioli pv. gladioli]MBJ9715262.1 DMT family transporter [Burkholderia gladioli]MBU9159057.1 DMT family transporter [Burkholderia gladioli]MBU9172365.1 DMT family transporter [Burkholderia gladioli]MBU9427521.1 DMT family transporter [Burkholderia gladioli]